MAQRASLLTGPFMRPARLFAGAKMQCSFPRRSFRARLRAIAALPRTCILIAACRGAVSSREGKEPRTTPGGAGDGAGDGGQARISRALPVEAIGDDGDAVARARRGASARRGRVEGPLAR